MSMTKVFGREGISASIIADSTANGIRITTFELEYPRFILSELNTHRILSKNSASSRAIPIKKMHEHIRAHTARPVFWGLNKPGMQATEEATESCKAGAYGLWNAARDSAIAHARILDDMGIHKQIVNRLTEPFMMMKTVLTGTEFANLIWLRHHTDAQPEFLELVDCMVKAMECSIPDILAPGQWHLPYIKTKDNRYFVGEEEVDLETALKVSVSCCAQVSYRKLDDSIAKAIDIYDRLITSEPVHASPIEHQATPMIRVNVADVNGDDYLFMEEGVTHVRRDGFAWSGNFRGWIQNRQLIPGNTKW